jgi:hypothetical protein
MHFLVLHPHRARRKVNGQIAAREDRLLCFGRATLNRAHPREQFRRAEWLPQIIVRAVVGGRDFIGFAVAHGQHE